MNQAKSLLARLFLGAVISVSALSGIAHAQSCLTNGSYAYTYNGTNYVTPPGQATFSEVGTFQISRQNFSQGEGNIAFQFTNFGGAAGPLWLMVHEVQTNGAFTFTSPTSCEGTFNFLATGTVTATSNPNIVPVGTVLYTSTPRSTAFTLSGFADLQGDMISTSPGTIATGTFRHQ
jgi:hypothetical protein